MIEGKKMREQPRGKYLAEKKWSKDKEINIIKILNLLQILFIKNL